jgi:hypothetical protein
MALFRRNLSTRGITKDCISSPIEAGPSLFESQKLSPQLSLALDHVSDRLMRKNVHLTLVVARLDRQLPSSPSLIPSSPTPPRSPSPFSIPKVQIPSLPTSPMSISSFGSSTSSPFSPLFPPSSPTCTTPQSCGFHGISLYNIDDISPKASRHLQESIAKASKKYRLGDGWLVPPSSTAPDGPTGDLIRRSLQQHEVVFSSESLILISLDRVYTFKVALAAYSRTFVPCKNSPLSRDEKLKQRNEAKIRAVDELRLLVLSQKGRRISQSYLMRSYDHLSVTVPSLRSVNEAYKACFHADGIEMEALRPLLTNIQLSRSISGKRLATENPDTGPHFRAPHTPGGYDDVTPVTRNEWDNLMWGRANLATVEICG